MKDIEFDLTVTAEEPNEGESPNRKLRFSGVAVTSVLNKKNLEFTKEALGAMAQFRSVPICIGSHKDARENPDSTIGLTDDFSLSEDESGNLKLEVGGYLFPEDDRARRLHEKMINYPAVAGQIGMSVSGKPGTGGMREKFGPEGTLITQCNNWVDFNHILVCRRSAAVDGQTAFDVQQADWGEELFEATLDLEQDETTVEIVDAETPQRFTITTSPWAPHLAVEATQFLFAEGKDKAEWRVPVYEVDGAINLNAMHEAVQKFDELDTSVQEAVRGQLVDIHNLINMPVPDCLQEVTASADAVDEQVSQTEGYKDMKTDKRVSILARVTEALFGTQSEEETEQTEATEEDNDTTEESVEENAAEEKTEETTEQTVDVDAIAAAVTEKVLAAIAEAGKAETTEETSTEQTEAESTEEKDKTEEETTEETKTEEESTEETEQTTEDSAVLELAGVVKEITEQLAELKGAAPISAQAKLAGSKTSGGDSEDSGDLLSLGTAFHTRKEE